MQQLLQALATSSEQRWANKIGQGLGFRIRMEAQERQEASGRRRGNRLNAEKDQQQAAHRLTEPMVSATSNITSKGGGSGKRGLFVSESCK